MKYEVGDKFLIEVVSVLKSDYLMSNNTFLEEHKLKESDKYNAEKEELYEIGFKAGLEKAWKYAKLIGATPESGGMQDYIIEEIFSKCDFDDVFSKYKIEDVIEIIDEYLKQEKEKKGNNIKVGDIVAIDDGDIRFVVTKDDFDGDENRCSLMAFDGSVWEGCPKEMCQKTGISVNFANVLGQLEGCTAFIEPLEVIDDCERIS